MRSPSSTVAQLPQKTWYWLGYPVTVTKVHEVSRLQLHQALAFQEPYPTQGSQERTSFD